jgi:hypothetical protein
MKQTVNLRMIISRTVLFGSDYDREKYERELEAAIAAQKVSYAIAPSCSVVCSDGIVRVGGEEVTLALLAQADVTPRARLSRLIASGIVIDASDRIPASTPPEAA